MDDSSIVSSFYEAPEVYDEGRTRALYESLKKNFEDINEVLVSVDKDMKHFQKQCILTVKLIEKIKTSEIEANQHNSQQ